MNILNYIIVHDCGTVINPMIVEGQIHGTVLEGISGVLYESAQYGGDGQVLTSTLMDYLLPTVNEAVNLTIENMVSPSPFTPIGAKGVGEGGTMAAPAAIANAIEDALSQLSVEFDQSYLPPWRIWEILREKAPRPY